MRLKLTFLIFLMVAPQVFALSAAEELAQLLDNIHTMQATFTQVMIDNKDVETKGMMTLERPGKFRWEVLQPNKQLIIINKDKLLLYDLDLAQITKRRIDYKKPGNPAILLSGSTNTLKQMFKIKKLKASIEEVLYELRIQKKGKSSGDYQWVRMFFVRGQLKAMYVLDNFDQQTKISFSNISLNEEIRPDKFKLVIPSNVDVVEF